ncbi:hypothetical protein ACWD3J_44695 [Streptomyces sp. NPDC002755]
MVGFGGRVLEERTVALRGDGDLRTHDGIVAKDGFGDTTAVWSALDHGYPSPPRPSATSPNGPSPSC